MIELSLENVPVPELSAEEVLVRVEAAPINPSDLGVLFGPADVSSARRVGAKLEAPVPEKLRSMLKSRLNIAIPCGNEGAGVVVRAGASPGAQALLGKTVGLVGGAMYSQYRKVKAAACLVFPDGTPASQCASWFVNPMTALGMVETMRREGHTALVHTAAASNLGQMLNKICLADKVELVNIVRKEEHVEILRAIGAQHVVNSSSATFKEDLTAALVATGATIAFDAIGGGRLAGTILACMEKAAAARGGGGFSVYGSDTHKQVYIYGGLDRSATVLNRNFGMTWGVGGWLLTPFLKQCGREVQNKFRARVAAEICSTFSSSYTKQVSLEEALSLSSLKEYAAQSTGTKYLINPNKGQTFALSKL